MVPSASWKIFKSNRFSRNNRNVIERDARSFQFPCSAVIIITMHIHISAQGRPQDKIHGRSNSICTSKIYINTKCKTRGGVVPPAPPYGHPGLCNYYSKYCSVCLNAGRLFLTRNLQWLVTHLQERKLERSSLYRFVLTH